MSTTPQQQAVIEKHSGTVLVKAVPGAGKTTTLVNRCKALNASDTKLVLAFNKSAAEDFARRMGSVSQCDVRTFHSFCFRTLMGAPKDFGYTGKPTLIQDVPLFRQLCQANGVTYSSWDESGWDQDYIQSLEHSCYTPELQYLYDSEDDLMTRKTIGALITYRHWLLQNKYVTFDAMVRLVAENSSKLKIAAQHVMVDEYQDVDQFQFDISCAIARIKGVKSFAVVGDPNQRIYEWRGALNDAFKSMQDAFPNCETLPMTCNFRSVDGILKYADEICPTGMTGVRGDAEGSVSYLDELGLDGQGNRVVDKDLALKTLQQGYNGKLSDLAILCRYNRDAARWQIKLAKDGIPVYLIGKGDFWLMKHIKMAKDAWRKGMDRNEFLDSDEWRKFINQKKFRDDEDKANEAIGDALFVLELSKSEMVVMEDNLQDERRGIKISTIHRTKGMEFDRTLISNVSEHLKSEKFVYYVAATRAKNKMVIG